MRTLDLGMVLTMALHGNIVHIIHSGYTVAKYNSESRVFEMATFSDHLTGDLEVAQELVKARPEYYENKCAAFKSAARHRDKVTLTLTQENGKVVISQGPVIVAIWTEGRVAHAGNASPHASTLMRYHLRDLHEACQSVHDAAQANVDKAAIRRLLFEQRGSATAQRLLDYLESEDTK